VIISAATQAAMLRDFSPNEPDLLELIAGELVCGTCSASLKAGHPEVLADLTGEIVVDLAMARDGRAVSVLGVVPP